MRQRPIEIVKLRLDDLRMSLGHIMSGCADTKR